MKKTIIASAIALTSLASVNANADIAITNMLFVGSGQNFAAGGNLLDAGGGSLFSIDPFYAQPWTATQETTFMDNTGSWSGTSASGAYDANAVIAGMSAGQVAVGIFFDWNLSSDIAVLEIFDCAAGVCTGTGPAMLNGPFAGQSVVFSGTGSASVVPVPAAAWLMGSGLLGLVGVARRRKQA